MIKISNQKELPYLILSSGTIRRLSTSKIAPAISVVKSTYSLRRMETTKLRLSKSLQEKQEGQCKESKFCKIALRKMKCIGSILHGSLK